MKQTDLDILLREGEGSMLEYKESFSLHLPGTLAVSPTVQAGKSFWESVMGSSLLLSGQTPK